MSNPADLQTAINTAKRLEGGLSLTTQHQTMYSLEEKVAQLSEQLLALQGQPVKIPNCQNEGHMARDCNMPTRCGNCKRNSHIWKEYPSIKCAKCDEKGHVMGNCHSEKINWLKDTVEPLQILKRSTKQPETVEFVAPLK